MNAFVGKKLALLSVTDKTGLSAFAKGLVDLGYTLLSTGGTAKLLAEHGLRVAEVAEYTGSPEILDGRVKTLHPKVHGAILYDRSNPAHERQVFQAGIGRIDLVVVNLYRFHDEAVAKGLSAEAAIEHIDIGGPTMLRAAAKNWEHVLPVVDPADYDEVLLALENLRRGDGPTKAWRREMAAKVFRTISTYDAEVAAYIGGDAASPSSLPLTKVQDLRYGENPHQKAALYATGGTRHGFGAPEILQGKELSYNNILDLDAATALAAEFDETAAVIVKHTNPCGVASFAGELTTVFARALACDPKSAFGGIVAVNRRVDRAAAEAMTSFFVECIAAPEFAPEALELFKAKPALRVLRASWCGGSRERVKETDAHVRSVRGGLLVQDVDGGNFHANEWKAVTQRAPKASELADMRFAMIVAKHVKSNAIVFAKDGATVGIGAGQMSRIDSANVAVQKAAAEKLEVSGAVMASDAFFPFRDTVEFAASHGVSAIVQPGGSKKDQDSIDAANVAGIAMVFTGERHFRH